MARPAFVTVADDLLASAEAIERHFENKGYKVTREPTVIGYPYAPTLRCKHERTTLVIEVDRVIRTERADDWIRFGSSLPSDFRVAMAIPAGVRDTAAEDALRTARAGLYVVGDGVTEICMPHDLSVNLALPELARLPRKVRQALAPMYEQYEHSHWREAFESGCQAFEAECRNYLKAGIASGRIVVLDSKGRKRTLTSTQVDRMTLGALSVAFANIETPNHADTELANILSQVNPHRVGVAHHKTTPATEAKLRRHVGRDVYLFVAGLRRIFE